MKIFILNGLKIIECMGVGKMMESLVIGKKEVANEGFDSKSFDFPSFVKFIEPREINNFKEADKPLYIDTRNENLEGKKHMETGVEFESKIVELPDGREVEGVFPKFDTPFKMKLDESLFQESDEKQFGVANEKLKEGIENNQDLRNKFTGKQIEQISDNETPEGYTWHHSEDMGVMQLVDAEVHASTGHTGGRTLWGGGSENR